jgi:transcriptional regulator with XRE-family HTH domain
MIEHPLGGNAAGSVAFASCHTPYDKAYLPGVVKHISADVGKNAGMNTLGERIEARATKVGCTPQDIAKACSITDKAVYQWYSGATNGLKPENLVRVAKLLKTTVEWLVFEEEPEERPVDRNLLHGEVKEAVTAFEALDAAYRAAALAAMKTFAEQQNLTQSGNS